MRWLRYAIIPGLAALAALFAVLPSTGEDLTVRIEETAAGFTYSPASIRLARGDRIAFENVTGATHTATCDACPWTTGDIQPGQRKMLTFDENASYRFACRYHGVSSGLQGDLTVGSGGSSSPEPTGGATPAPSGSPTEPASPRPGVGQTRTATPDAGATG